MLVTSIFSFSHNVFYPFQNEFHFFSHIFFVVCKSFNLDQSKILSFGKELNQGKTCVGEIEENQLVIFDMKNISRGRIVRH